MCLPGLRASAHEASAPLWEGAWAAPEGQSRLGQKIRERDAGWRKKRDERKSGRFGGSLEREGRGQSGKHRHYLTVAFTVKSLLTGQGQESQESQQHQVNGLRVQGLALHPR